MSLLHDLYEGNLHRWLPPLYKVNPCDIGALRWFAHVGDITANLLTTPCPCCTAFRIVAAFFAGIILPTAWALWLAAGALAGVATLATWRTLLGPRSPAEQPPDAGDSL